MTPSRDDALATVIAAAVHEIKNEFGVLFSKLDALDQHLQLDAQQAQTMAQAKTIANRINLELMRVLSVYKHQGQHFQPAIAQVFVEEFLQDTQTRHGMTATAYDLSLSVDCPDELNGFFDEQLVQHVLDTCIYNAAKHGAKHVRLSARAAGSAIQIEVADDGPGFPDALLSAGAATHQPIDFNAGNTGLGLQFATAIAALHCNAGAAGTLTLGNGPPLGGAVVRLQLP